MLVVDPCLDARHCNVVATAIDSSHRLIVGVNEYPGCLLASADLLSAELRSYTAGSAKRDSAKQHHRQDFLSHSLVSLIHLSSVHYERIPRNVGIAQILVAVLWSCRRVFRFRPGGRAGGKQNIFLEQADWLLSLWIGR